MKVIIEVKGGMVQAVTATIDHDALLQYDTSSMTVEEIL